MAIKSYPPVISITDHYGVQQYNAPNGESVAVPLYKLIGDVFTGPALDPNFWTTTLGTGGSASITGGELVISTGTTANNSVEVTSQNARFSGLAPNKLRIVVQLPDTGVANNVRHWGLWTATDGATFEMNQTTFQLTTRKGGVDSVITSGNFNGQYGPTFAPGLTSHFYEIIYQPRQVIWLADNKIIHTLSAANTTWTGNLHLPIHYGNVNSGGSTTNVSFSTRIATVASFGIPEKQPVSVFVSRAGTDIAQNLKNSPGNIHDININSVVNNAVISFYDTATIPIPVGARLICSTGAMSNNTFPFDMKGGRAPFYIGLSITITTANASAWVRYE